MPRGRKSTQLCDKVKEAEERLIEQHQLQLGQLKYTYLLPLRKMTEFIESLDLGCVYQKFLDTNHIELSEVKDAMNSVCPCCRTDTDAEQLGFQGNAHITCAHCL